MDVVVGSKRKSLYILRRMKECFYDKDCSFCWWRQGRLDPPIMGERSLLYNPQSFFSFPRNQSIGHFLLIYSQTLFSVVQFFHLKIENRSACISHSNQKLQTHWIVHMLESSYPCNLTKIGNEKTKANKEKCEKSLQNQYSWNSLNKVAHVKFFLFHHLFWVQ